MSKAIEKENKMGVMPMNRLLLGMALPMVASMLVQALYNVVDSIYVSMIGQNELNAVSMAFPIQNIVISIASGLGVGVNALISRSLGEGKRDAANRYAALGIFLSAISYVIMLLIGIFGAEAFFRSQTSVEGIIEGGTKYLSICCIFSFGAFGQIIFEKLMQSTGKTSLSMYTQGLGAIINIILDPVFIFGFEMGMFGAALATIIGQAATFIVTLIYFRNTKTFKLRLKSFIPKYKRVKEVVKLGVSTFITQIAIVIVVVICNYQLSGYGALSKYGAVIPMAIVAIQSKLFTIVINLVVGIALGCQPIISYNMGAKRFDRVRELYRKIFLCTIIIGISFTLLFELAPDFVLRLFGEPANIDNKEDYWEFGRKMLQIFLSLLSVSCFIKMNSIFFQAVGKPTHAIIASMVRDIACFAPLMLILPMIKPDVELLLYAAPISDFIAMIVTIILSLTFLKSLHRAEKELLQNQ